MLTAESLVRKYGDHVAVNGVSFEVAKGSCFGLLGPNGAGKTSTIGMLAGIVHPNSGKVVLNGEAVSPEATKVKAKIGYVPQEIALYEEISSVANLEFFAALYGLFGGAAKREIDRVLEIANLTDRVKEPVSKFSGGMKRRLNIAASLLHKPEFLILDEPTVGVDPQSRNAIFEAIEHLRAEGMTLLYTSHYMEEVERLCDQIAIMDLGQIVLCDSKASLLSRAAERSAVIVEVGDESEAADLAIRLGEVGLQAHQTGDKVDVAATDLAADLASISQATQGLRIRSISSNRATLEEVFLSLTGKSLRD